MWRLNVEQIRRQRDKVEIDRYNVDIDRIQRHREKIERQRQSRKTGQNIEKMNERDTDRQTDRERYKDTNIQTRGTV